ncbi:hypothetical protein OFL77_27830, partial [Escherichia coli]|uniref:hypothetical protein n=1 Tax=Escherichia coli TaxID=562 RepID=UPI0021E0FABE
DLSHRFGYGLYEGGTAISNSIRDFTNKATGGILDSKGEGIFQKLGLYDSNEERTQKLEQQQESLPMVEGKRFTTKYLG